jgi:hypothetical protein
MAPHGGPPTSDDRPATAPLVPRARSRWPPTAAALVLASLTFLVGFRLGGAGAAPAVVLPSDGGQAAPAASTTSPPIVQADAVSSALASTAGGLVPRYGWAVCFVDLEPIVCDQAQPITAPLNDLEMGPGGPPATPPPAMAALWRALPAYTSVVVGAHVVLVAAVTAATRGVLVARVQGGSFNLIVPTVEPGRHGIDYFDLGVLAPGEYLVGVLAQVYGGVSDTAAPPTIIPTQVVGILVGA